MNEIVTKINNNTLYEVYDMKASVTQKNVYDVCNEEVINCLKKEKFDVNTIELILKTFVLAEDDLQHLEQSMHLAYLLRNVEGMILSKTYVDINKICSLYTDFIKRVDIINNQIKEVLPDTDKAKDILHAHKDIVSMYEETKQYNKVMAEMLDIHMEYDESTLHVDNLPFFKLYPLLNIDDAVGKYYIEDYITLFYDYFDMALDVLEAFIKYYENLFTTKCVQEEVQHSSINPDVYEDPKKVKVLLKYTIFELYDVLEEENQMGAEYYDRDALSEMALTIVEERFSENIFDKECLVLLEKALLLAFKEENVKKAWIYISMIINQIEGFDADDDVLKLALIEGELAKKTLALFTFDTETLFNEMDEVNEFIFQSLIAMEGKDKLEANVKRIAKIFEELLNRYYDYIQNTEEELEEDYVAALLNKFNIESDDPLDYIASVIEYYEDFDHKLYKIDSHLHYMQ